MLFSRRHFAACVAVGVTLYILNILFHLNATDEDLRPAYRDSTAEKAEGLAIPAVPVFSDRFSGYSIYTAVEDAYFRRLEGVHVRCDPLLRVGGSWRVCASPAFAPRPAGCLVYSFGVHHRWDFEEALAASYGCTVRAFDPSMTRVNEHVHLPGPVHFYKAGLGGKNQRRLGGWQMRTLQAFLQRFNESQRVLDLVKIDIEFFEWEAFEAMLASGSLTKVKQIVAEVHTDDINRRPTSIAEYRRYHKVLDGIERLGFRRCYRHQNDYGVERVSGNRDRSRDAILQRSGELGRSCCHQLTYVNMHFAKDRSGLQLL